MAILALEHRKTCLLLSCVISTIPFVKDKSRNPNSDRLIGLSESSADVEKQIALERRSLAELLLDFYEARFAKERRGLDAEPQETTMKERSKTNVN